MLHIYIPDEENPNRQGRWVCPINELHGEESSLWLLPTEEQKVYLANSKFFRFLKDGQDKCSD